MDYMAGMDYAGAWQAKRGICHRFIYDEFGKPTECPQPVIASGWTSDGRGHWYAVDACERHASQLERRPVCP